MTMLSRFAATGGGGDPYWTSVSYLLVGNGANGTTTNIKDSSSNNLATIVNGSVVISTAKNKYGVGSVYFPGATTDYLSVSNTSVLEMGASDFTIEGWVLSSISGNSCILAEASGQGATNTSWGIFTGYTNSTSIDVYCSNGSTYFANTGGGVVNDGQWHYFAFSRNGSSGRLYLNGTQIGVTLSLGTVSLAPSGKNLTIGSQASNYPFPGYMYDLRITKGVARYTGSTMTVPTAPLPIG